MSKRRARADLQKLVQFFDALREALIQNSPNDANALALDGTEVVLGKIPGYGVRCGW